MRIRLDVAVFRCVSWGAEDDVWGFVLQIVRVVHQGSMRNVVLGCCQMDIAFQLEQLGDMLRQPKLAVR